MATPSAPMRLVSAATLAVLVATATEMDPAPMHLASPGTLATDATGTDPTSLLQTSITIRPLAGASHASAEAKPDYWPHPRGRLERYAYTPSGFLGESLNASLAWTWGRGPEGNDLLWSTLIDAEKNVYLFAVNAVVKFNPDGQVLWKMNGMNLRGGSLMDGAVFVHEVTRATLFRIDAETGKVTWQKKVGPKVGAAGDMVETHDGVAIVGVGQVPGWNMHVGIPSAQAHGFNASDGAKLWEFTPDCGFWQLMPLFPGDDTAILMDQCGGLYRIGIHNGTVFWRRPGPLGSFSDGGAILGPDGGTYTCSMPGSVLDGSSNVNLPDSKGVIRKYRLADGQMLWETETPMPCLNMPAVSHDGRKVFTAVGALTPVDGPYWSQFPKTPLLKRAAFVKQEQARSWEQRQRSYYNMPDLTAMVMGLSTETGEVQLQHELEPYGNIAAAGDDTRNLAFLSHKGFMPHCGPPAFSSVTVDSRDRLYFGRNNGKLYIFDTQSRTSSEYDAGDGFMLAGASFAPGMMAIPTCGKLLVFKYKEM